MISDNYRERRKKLKVNIQELVSEMDLGDNLELTAYLDTETGEIISMPDNVMRAAEEGGETVADLADWEKELIQTAESIFGDDKNRFLEIPHRQSYEGYNLMVAFAETVHSKGIREKLDIALDGKRAFQRFRNVLNDHPDELERWYAFKEESMREEAVQWLIVNGIEPIQVMSGYFNDDGSEFNADLVPKPGLCLTCRKDNAGGKEEILCILTRNDQKGDTDFECGAYEPNQ
ncbi:MAG: UPF0158 family protein [bacterium]